MLVTRRGLLMGIGLVALSGCSGPRSKKSEDDKKSTTAENDTAKKGPEESNADKQEDEKSQIVDETTNYLVYRVDIKHGITGTYESYTENTEDFSSFYAVLSPDGDFTFDINGVAYNCKVELGEDTKTLYSGIEDHPAKRLLLDGNKFGNVGTVDFEVFMVEQDLLIDTTTSDDEGMVFANFYLRKDS